VTGNVETSDVMGKAKALLSEPVIERHSTQRTPRYWSLDCKRGSAHRKAETDARYRERASRASVPGTRMDNARTLAKTVRNLSSRLRHMPSQWNGSTL